MTNLDAIERRLREEGTTNLALRNMGLELLALVRAQQEQMREILQRDMVARHRQVFR